MAHRRRRWALLWGAVSLCAPASLSAQTPPALPAFPGAEGAGSAATGGRGGDVYIVTNLNDTGTGSFRNAFSGVPSAGRTVVFRVAGTIYLNSDINITASKVTIAGQTAPAGGITLAYRRFRITNTNNVVVRHLRTRVSNFVTSTTDPAYQPDATWVSGSSNIVLDHLSAGWSVDEVLSVTDSANVSVQWSTISEALNNAGHSSGAHSYGSLISGNRVSYHHNLYAHNNSRNPRPQVLGSGQSPGVSNFDFRNNVLFNWGDQAGYNGDEAGTLNMNYVGNYFVAGPTTPSSKVSRAFLFGLTTSNVFQSGNRIDPNKNLVRDGTDTGTAMFSGSPTTWAAAPVGNPGYVTPQTAVDAYAQVLAYGGARWWARDAVDTRVYGDVVNMTGSIIDSHTAVGGYPTLPTGTAPTDSDNDGMPNTWETALGLNPNVANNNADFDSDGYTDLEEYLNELAAWPAPAPAVWNVASGRYALAANFNTRWQPSRFDTVQVNSGTATVDAVGQDAGTVQLGALVVASNTPTLSVSSGWLRVAGDVVVGQAVGTSARLNLSGGKLLVGGTLRAGSSSDAVVTWTGGTLAAAAVDASNLRFSVGGPVGALRQSATASTLAPGDTGTAGRTAITGGYALSAGTLALELGGSTAATSYQAASAAFDNVTATGTLELSGGTLNLALLNAYNPAFGTPHIILSGASRTGVFGSVTGFQVQTGKWLAVTYTPTSVVVTAALPGDIDLSGAVAFTDLVEIARNWQLTSRSWATGDLTGDSVTDNADLTTFQTYYTPVPGYTFAQDWARAQRLVMAIPEPATAGLFAAAVVPMARRRRTRT